MIKTHHRTFYGPALVLILTLAAGACTQENPAFESDPFLPGECRSGSEFTETIEGFARPDKLDILIVVDNSGDVLDLQTALADALPEFLNPLSDLDVHVGVATTDATGAARLAQPGTVLEDCASNGDRVARSEASNFTRVAQCNVVQGDDGDPFQQSLGVVRRLFFDASPQDLGFFRSDARLLVLIASNEDDCTSESPLGPSQQARQTCLDESSSLVDVDELLESLEALKKPVEALKFAVLSGVPDSEDNDQVRAVCSSGLGAVYPAPRLFALTEALGDRGAFRNACVENLRSTMRELARHASPRTTTLCPSRPLAHEPLAVDAVVDGQRQTIRVGEDGFTFLGRTEACPNGALQFNGLSLARATAVEATYCADD